MTRGGRRAILGGMKADTFASMAEPLTEPTSLRRARKRRIRSSFGTVTLLQWHYLECARLIGSGRDVRLAERSGRVWLEELLR